METNWISNSNFHFVFKLKSNRVFFSKRPDPIPISKSHQFIGSSQTNGGSGKPDWQRALIDRRRAGANEKK